VGPSDVKGPIGVVVAAGTVKIPVHYATEVLHLVGVEVHVFLKNGRLPSNSALDANMGPILMRACGIFSHCWDETAYVYHPGPDMFATKHCLLLLTRLHLAFPIFLSPALQRMADPSCMPVHHSRHHFR